MIAWASDFAAGYDSPWSLIQKLSWLNCTPAADILKAAGIVIAPSSRSALVKRRCDEVDWLGPRSASTESGLTTQAHRFVLDVKANFARSEFSRPLPIPLHAGLRLCPICIRAGYHSVAHQLVGLARCPFHGAQLTSVCPKCSRWLPEYAVGDIWPAYSCPGCHGSWLANADRLPRVPPEWKVHEAKTIGTVVKWARELSQVTIQGLDALREGWWFRTSTTDDTAKVAYPEARIWVFHDLCPFPLGAAYLGQRPLGLVLRPSRGCRRMQRWNHASPATPHRDSPERAFAVVRHYLAQRRLVAHQQCIADAQKALVRTRMQGEDVFEFNRDICPVGYAYVLWCARLDNYVRWFRKVPIWEWGRISLRPAQQLSLELPLLNSFVGSLHQTVLLQALVKNHDSFSRGVASGVLYSDYDSWLPDPLLAGRNNIPAVNAAQVAIALEPADGLSELRCDHGRAMAAWERKQDELAEILERCDSGASVFDSKIFAQMRGGAPFPSVMAPRDGSGSIHRRVHGRGEQ